MITHRKKYANPDESAFLGAIAGALVGKSLFSGKKKEKEAAARVTVINAERDADLARKEAENKRLRLELEAAKQGYEPNEAIREANAVGKTDNNLYLLLGGVVVIVMLAVVFIKRK